MNRNILTAGAAALALIAGSAVAQTSEESQATEQTPEMSQTETGQSGAMATTDEVAPQLAEMTVGDLLGKNVHNKLDKTVGEIDYVILPPTGPEAVIGVGGFLGIGEYTVAVSLTEFEVSPDGEILILDTDKEALKALPEFDETGVEGLPRETEISEILDGTYSGPDDAGMESESSRGGTMTN